MNERIVTIEMIQNTRENLLRDLQMWKEKEQLKETMLPIDLAYQAIGIEKGINPKGLASELQSAREQIVKIEMTLEGLLRIEEQKQASE